MPMSASYDVTQLLLAWNDGDQTALDELIPLVQAELRQLASRYMRNERAGHTLQTTALINEVYLRLIEVRRVEWQSRAHFFGIASRLMRQILVDFARSRRYQKRGGGMGHLPLNEMLAGQAQPDQDVVALDEALKALAKVDERKSRVVEMRFFGGLREREIAVALEVSPETVRRDWRLAKSWLLRWLREGGTNEE
jgi:RNA polymerase sigma factor (TIGR02999 family)